jgi:two-component system sensor kinase FixL
VGIVTSNDPKGPIESPTDTDTGSAASGTTTVTDTRAFRMLLEAAPDAMLIIDPEGRISDINTQVEALFGYPRAELLGRNMEMLLPERFRTAHPQHRMRYGLEPRKRAMGASGIELYGRRQDGTEFSAEVSLSPMPLEGRLLVIATIRDGTARIKLSQAQEAIRLRDEFLSIASHELRTPLTPIQLQIDGALRAARRGGEQDLPIITRKLEALGNGIHRLASLVNQLLDLSRITSGRLDLERSEVDLIALIHRSLVAFEDEAVGVECALELEVQADKIRGRWDASRLEQVLTNLLSNALRYGTGRPVTVFAAELRSGWVTLLVRDQGIGVAEEHHDLIFQRFERVTEARNRGGFGLGLWIVRQIVEAHAGTIRVFSRPGIGSTFGVELPLGTAEPGPSHDQVLLLIDEDPVSRGTFRECLDGHQPWAVTAGNGFDALALLHFGVKPQLIIAAPDGLTPESAAYMDELRTEAAARNIPLCWLVAEGITAPPGGPAPRLTKPFTAETLRAFLSQVQRTFDDRRLSPA